MPDSSSRPHFVSAQLLPTESKISSDLLVAVGAGDEHAFAELYQRLVGTVFGIAREILRDATRAEEVTEVVFVDVWRTAGQYSPDHHGGGFEWVMAIAHRHAVVRLRSTGEARSARGSWRQVTNSKPDSTVAHSGLGALPPMQRESLELAYYGGMTYTEIGEFHHVAADRAKSLLRDALIRLRDRA